MKAADAAGTRVAVTGATGHLGASLLRALRARDDVGEIRAVVRPGRARDPRIEAHLRALRVTVVPGDVGDPAALAAAFAGADVVYHLAAFISILGGHGGRVWATNVTGAGNVGAAARAGGVRRLVHCSSVHAFALDGVTGAIDESSPRAGDRHPVYDRSKTAGEAALRAAATGVEVVVCHPTGVIGPDDHAPSRMGRFIRSLMLGRVPALVDGGFDWVDVRDVADALCAAGTRGRAGENYLLGGGHAEIRAIAALVAAASGTPAPRFVTPMALARLGAVFSTAYGLATRREPLFTSEALAPLRFRGRIATDKARRALGFAPRPLAVTIADTCAWFASQAVAAVPQPGAPA